MLLLNEDITHETTYSSALFAAFDSSSLIDLKRLLRSEVFKQNMSQTLNISTENLTELLNSTQLNQTWQYERQRKAVLILLSVFYALIILAGFVGNIITCVVILCNKFMHTATNLYLLNLAISDLLLLITGAPQDVYSYWYPNNFQFNDTVCRLTSVLSETATNATVLTISAFTVERYIAICHPFFQCSMSRSSRAIRFIICIWVTALLAALPQAAQFSVVVEPNGTSCTIHDHFYEHVFALSGFVFFIVPMTVICVLYILIGLKLKSSRMLQTIQRHHIDMNRNVSSQGRVIRMLCAVAAAFFLCWAPFHAQRLMAVYGSSANIESKLFKDVFEIVDMVSGIMYYLSTCINPLLYSIMSNKFRDAFSVTFRCPGRYRRRKCHGYNAYYRPNGSMRLHSMVNTNDRYHYPAYRTIRLHGRDTNHDHSSLQDSIRTTVTTLNSSAGTSCHVGVGCDKNASIRSTNCACARSNAISAQSAVATTAEQKPAQSAGINRMQHIPQNMFQIITFTFY